MITTVGGGAFGVVSAVIPVVTSQDEGNKTSGGKPGSEARSTPPSGRGTSAARPTPSPSPAKCGGAHDGWDEMGPIGTSPEFDAARMDVDFADVNGDGFDDYLVVNRETGEVKAWKNLNAINEKNQFRWEEPGKILTTGTDSLSAQNDIDFADLDGDGLDDYLMVDRETGAAKGWKTSASKERQIVEAGALGRPTWTIEARIPRATAGNTKVIFADIDGDGRDDHLTLDLDSGTVQAWFNREGSDGDQPEWKSIGQFRPTGLNEKDVPTFADADCDNRADYLVSSTAAKPLNVSLNGGIESNGQPRWGKEFEIANGGEFDPETQQRDFADLNGDGRDEVLWVETKTGKVTPHINKGGDPAPLNS
ncbi:FG-GAP-like repeat-containing protein [Streptomyces sp. NPDC002067]